jgi:hypothetical protein
MINRYFNHQTYAPEQDLLQDLIDETIQIHGHETYYLKRDDVDLDMLFGEDELAKFTQAFPIEMYIKNAQSFAGQSEFISKFGLVIEDQCTFSVSVRRFTSAVDGALSRPREGDIVWLQMTPTNRYLFEIKFVENKEQLFQLGKLYTYELRCELMNYTHERVDTKIPDVDNSAKQDAYTLRIELGAGLGTYIAGEVVFQGPSFVEQNATATVVGHDVTTNVLLVQDVSGTFGATGQIVGLTSDANYVPLAVPSQKPDERDPIADNSRLDGGTSGVIIIRGANPRRT